MIDSFFVYVHREADTGRVFYVGKGSRDKRDPARRAHTAKRRSQLWQNIVLKHGLIVEVVAWFEGEQDAFDVERGLIAFYGRRCDGGALCNLTLGGDGHKGHRPSEETRRKLIAAFSGDRHPNWGKKLSAETCAKKSASMAASEHNLRGKTLPDWWRDRIRATKMGQDNPMHGKTGMDHPRSRMVLLRGYNLVFESIKEAAEFIGWTKSRLHAQLTGIVKTNTTNMELI